MEINITGIQAAAKRNFKTFATLRPTGAVTLVHDTGNKYDSFAVKVLYETDAEIVELGFLPGQKRDGKYIGSDIQRHVIDNELTAANIIKFAYFNETDDSFNEDNIGVLGSVTLEIDIPQNDSGKAIGGKYQRVTSFISYFDAYGGGDGLIKWACEQIGKAEHKELEPEELFPAYRKALDMTADAGTLMHGAIEAVLGGGNVFTPEPGQLNHPELYESQESRGAQTGLLDGEFMAAKFLPAGWDNFRKKYDLDTCYMEERFFDNTLMVTGQPDWVGYVDGVLTVVDWKSSKKPSMKHKIQAAIYAKNAHWDNEPVKQAMVVAFGAETKQGFSTAKIDRAKIESLYTGMTLLRQCMTACGVWISKYWEGE